MDKEAIKQLLPHREPMLLVDEVELQNGEAIGRCHIKGNEWFLQGHYPGAPVVPGVILCEMMAQTCCVLLGGAGNKENVTPFFTGLDKVKFRRPVKPGETVETRCRIVRSKGPFHFAEGTGTVDGQTAVSAHFSFALVENKE